MTSKTIGITINDDLLKEFDNKIGSLGRSGVIETLMQKFVDGDIKLLE